MFFMIINGIVLKCFDTSIFSRHVALHMGLKFLKMIVLYFFVIEEFFI